jgi:hypothetical protein
MRHKDAVWGNALSLSLEKIESLAPDQGSLDAARKLLKPGQWPTLAADGAGLIWGECQGSGATPYRICVVEVDAGYKCSCPSRKFPCKHALALMWLRTDGKTAFVAGVAPEWVKDWLSRRRGPAEAAAATPIKPKASIAAVADGEDQPDPKAQVRAAAARERNRQDRENSIAGGLDELDTWLLDQTTTGLARFASNAINACRTISQRLVDAKASGLATRLDALPARLFACPDTVRPHLAVEELGQLHLMSEAYRRQDQLPPPLKADIRQAIGWTITREALLSDALAERLSGRWHVWTTRSEVQPDRLRRLETWLYSAGRFAVLIDFVPVTTGPAVSGYATGDTFDAELVFYPSPVPLRALLVTQTTGTKPGGSVTIPEVTLETAYASYEAALIARPWLDELPLTFQGAQVRRSGERVYVCGNTLALPLAAAQEASTWPLLQTGAIKAMGLWDGKTFDLRCAETEQGWWTA